MTDHVSYAPGSADSNVQIQKKDGEKWTLVFVRELRHSPEKVWQALTEPEQLRHWAPYEADGDMGTTGKTVKLTTLGAPTPHVSETMIERADAPRVLEFTWGGKVRWELEALDGGTRLTVWHDIDHRYIAMGAAGWHVSFDVLDRLLAGTPLVRGEAMKSGWSRLNAEYAKQFGKMETPACTPGATKS